MFDGIKNGWYLIEESIKAFNRYPKFIVPLLITWLIYAPIILYMNYGFEPDLYSTSQIFLIIFVIIFIFAFLLSFSCSVLLEMIQQLESGEEINIEMAYNETLSKNTIKILPLVFLWTVIWFILLVVQSLFSKKQKESKRNFNMENAAKTLSGYPGSSFLDAFFKAIEKGVRMIIFLILPAMCWENLSFMQSIKKGISVFKTNLSIFVTGFVLTGMATAIIYLPPAFLSFISKEMGINVPDWMWVADIIYIAFAWSYSIYLEQMFMAELYLWNYKWEKAVLVAQQEGHPIPSMYDIPRPTILDDAYDLIEKSSV